MRVVGEIELRADEVRVGDKVVGSLHDLKPNERVDWVTHGSIAGYYVATVIRDGDDLFALVKKIHWNGKVSENPDHWEPRYRLGALKYFVIRESGVQSKTIPDFPGKCTRCGRSAYVSAFSVDHADESAARDCPARRAR